jgi:hypothetical protein
MREGRREDCGGKRLEGRGGGIVRREGGKPEVRG